MSKVIRYSPLIDQYRNFEHILDDIRAVIKRGDFTLGREVDEFEKEFSNKCERKHAIGVGSGTDALKLALKAGGVKYGDEVITSANSFWAVVGGINELGAYPKLIDCGPDMQIDPLKIEEAITEKTSAIVPVHLAGNVCDMDSIIRLAKKNNLIVVEDGCQCQGATRNGLQVGSWGLATAISMHPLKILNIWGDGGIVITDNDIINDNIRLLRNHGLKDRDTMKCFGYNSRLDTIQAVVAKYVLSTLDEILLKRRQFGKMYINGLSNIDGIILPSVEDNVNHAYLYFVIFAERRDELKQYLSNNGIETKIHYPKPLYHQKALLDIGYKIGQFPVTDRQAKISLSLPVDQHLTNDDIQYVIEKIASFYGVKS